MKEVRLIFLISICLVVTRNDPVGSFLVVALIIWQKRRRRRRRREHTSSEGLIVNKWKGNIEHGRYLTRAISQTTVTTLRLWPYLISFSTLIVSVCVRACTSRLRNTLIFSRLQEILLLLSGAEVGDSWQFTDPIPFFPSPLFFSFPFFLRPLNGYKKKRSKAQTKAKVHLRDGSRLMLALLCVRVCVRA